MPAKVSVLERIFGRDKQKKEDTPSLTDAYGIKKTGLVKTELPFAVTRYESKEKTDGLYLVLDLRRSTAQWYPLGRYPFTCNFYSRSDIKYGVGYNVHDHVDINAPSFMDGFVGLFSSADLTDEQKGFLGIAFKDYCSSLGEKRSIDEILNILKNNAKFKVLDQKGGSTTFRVTPVETGSERR